MGERTQTPIETPAKQEAQFPPKLNTLLQLSPSRPSQMEQLCEKWRPYRSVGAWYMWRVVQGKGSPSLGSAVASDGNVVQPLQQIEVSQDGQHSILQFVESVRVVIN